MPWTRTNSTIFTRRPSTSAGGLSFPVCLRINSNWKIPLTSCWRLVNLSRANVHIGGRVSGVDDDFFNLYHSNLRATKPAQYRPYDVFSELSWVDCHLNTPYRPTVQRCHLVSMQIWSGRVWSYILGHRKLRSVPAIACAFDCSTHC